MNFTFNINQDNEKLLKMIEMCRQHYQCDGCPIKEQGAIKDNMTGIMYSCSTAIIEKIKKNNGKM